jgi:3'-phosphoadenosine 5'-phosphosulfate sulfotransferase (PAPS reductase)/FAD synthetase
VQTTALLVLVAENGWPRPDVILFADTGGEKDGTYTYLRDVARPYAQAHGLNIHTLGAYSRSPSYRPTLQDYSLMHKMVPGTFSRWCTEHYKIRALRRAYRWLGVTEEWIGMSSDEPNRLRPSTNPLVTKRYPLAEKGLTRANCAMAITNAGLPLPPKSGCWYCPFQKRSQWQEMKRNRPGEFAQALFMERNAQGKDGSKKYLPMFGSLESVAAQDELPGFDEAIEDEAGCVTGSCFT